MKRREFVQKLGVGSAAAAWVSGAGATDTTTGAPATSDHRQEHGGDNHDHRPVKGALASAMVSFGQWKTDPPLDRYPNGSPTAATGHLVAPHQVAIKIGGSVNFIVSGVHQVIVYAPGTTPEDINSGLTRPTTGTPSGVALINDPLNRLYAGPDPTVFLAPTPLRDRVEVVQFNQTGRHLVICGVQSHFLDNMYGWVRVLPDDGDD
jgi:hypothetical protein